ncbi:oligosaccharide flippase family protein [Candidatus Gottesmanbacteria bacterium]|nr:oligosaccharide flippase family protein [Candidatus Gottesmanbacteria bacterium]
MQESEIFAIKGKIVGGIFALTTRTFLLQIISFSATVVLTILLTPEIFGIYYVVSAVIAFLAYFSDIGFAAALIQKKEEPSDDELATVFTIQQLLVGSLVLTAFILAPFFANFYNLSSSGVFLLRALIIAFFLSSLKTISSVLLERKLEFSLLVIPQLLETVGFYLVAIVLAYRGFGVDSFAWAALTRGIIGLLAIYIVSPWKIRLGVNINAIKQLLTFGVPFQTNSILALVKDDLMTIFLGKILPFTEIGYIGWAKKWAEVPLRLIMDSIIRVTFPAYSRLRENSAVLKSALEKSFFALSLVIFPASSLLILTVHPLIYIIPKYQKWEPAIFSFYIFTIVSIIAAFSTTSVNAMNALGKIKITLILMVLWTVLTWTLIPGLVPIFGFNGVSVAFLLIAVTSFIPIFITKQIVHFTFIAHVYKPFFVSMLLLTGSYLLQQSFSNIFGVILSVVVFTILYGLFLIKWYRQDLLTYMRLIVS